MEEQTWQTPPSPQSQEVNSFHLQLLRWHTEQICRMWRSQRERFPTARFLSGNARKKWCKGWREMWQSAVGNRLWTNDDALVVRDSPHIEWWHLSKLLHRRHVGSFWLRPLTHLLSVFVFIKTTCLCCGYWLILFHVKTLHGCFMLFDVLISAAAEEIYFSK